METNFMKEFSRLHGGNVSYTQIRPDPNNRAEMKNLPALVMSKKPDLIYTWGTPTTLAVVGTEESPVIRNVPAIFTIVAYPTRSGIAKNPLRPRANLTGTSHLVPLKIQFSKMQKLHAFKKIGVLFNSTESQTKFMLDDLKDIATAQDIELFVEDVVDPATGLPNPGLIPLKVKSLKDKGAGWLYIGPDTFIGYTHRELTTRSAAQVGIPSFSPNQSPIKDAFATLGVFNPTDEMGKFNAFKAIQLLTLKPGQRVPIDTLQRFTVMVNTCVTKELNLPIPIEIEVVAEMLTEQNGSCKRP